MNRGMSQNGMILRTKIHHSFDAWRAKLIKYYFSCPRHHLDDVDDGGKKACFIRVDRFLYFSSFAKKDVTSSLSHGSL